MTVFGRHAQPPALSGWTPMATPAVAAGGRFPRLKRQAIIVGGLTLLALFTGILAAPRGWVAVGLAWAVVGFLGNARAEGRTLRTVVQYATVAVLVAMVAGVGPTPPAKVKAPAVKRQAIEATQSGQLEDIRQGVVNLYEQIATGFSKPPPANKEGR